MKEEKELPQSESESIGSGFLEGVYKICCLCLFFTFSLIQADPSAEEAFTDIYKNKVWGGTSGGGSTLETTELYRAFLQKFFAVYNIHSVVDAGCGDWEFSQAMDWSGITYRGYDVVESVIANNQASFSSPTIQFFQGDITALDLPQADLLICKDVLQHLPNEDIFDLLTQFPKFKYCLITNDIDHFEYNAQIERGGYRPLDLTCAPFYLRGNKIFTFISGPNVKQVLILK